MEAVLERDRILEQLEQIKIAKCETLSKIKAYKENHGAEFFKPFPHQQRAIDYLWAGKKTVVLQGANQIGKSIFGSNIVGSFAIGKQLWDKKESLFKGRPTKGRIICADWEHHAKEVIVPKLIEWLPKGTYETRKNNTGVEAYFYFKNGSTFELMTHIQDTKSHEGWTGDWVWADEPLPKDKYEANKRGLVARNGVFILTMTAISEPWILDEIILNPDPSIGCVTNVPIEANTTLDTEAIRVFANSCSEETREARIKGGWFQLVGLVCKEFNKDIHVVEPFKVPTDFPVVAMIDLHLSTPQAISFYAVDKQGRQYVVHEVWENLSPEEVADEIIRCKKQNTWGIQDVYIDPLSKGDNQFVKNRMDINDSFSIIRDRLVAHGMQLHVASKDKNSGVRNVKNGLMGANKMPSLFFFNTCLKHIWEIQRWCYDEEGKPQKQDDHFMENLYRFTLTNTVYASPELWGKKLKYSSAGIV